MPSLLRNMHEGVRLALHRDGREARQADVEIEPRHVAGDVFRRALRPRDLVDAAVRLVDIDHALVDLHGGEPRRAMRGEVAHLERGRRDHLVLVARARDVDRHLAADHDAVERQRPVHISHRTRAEAADDRACVALVVEIVGGVAVGDRAPDAVAAEPPHAAGRQHRHVGPALEIGPFALLPVVGRDQVGEVLQHLDVDQGRRDIAGDPADAGAAAAGRGADQAAGRRGLPRLVGAVLQAAVAAAAGVGEVHGRGAAGVGGEHHAEPALDIVEGRGVGVREAAGRGARGVDVDEARVGAVERALQLQRAGEAARHHPVEIAIRADALHADGVGHGVGGAQHRLPLLARGEQPEQRADMALLEERQVGRERGVAVIRAGREDHVGGARDVERPVLGEILDDRPGALGAPLDLVLPLAVAADVENVAGLVGAQVLAGRPRSTATAA